MQRYKYIQVGDRQDLFRAMRDQQIQINVMIMTISTETNGLSPKVNVGLSPKVNVGLSPKINIGLSPKVNVSLSPKVNVSSSPKVNVGLSPRSKSAFLPRLTSAFLPRSTSRGRRRPEVTDAASSQLTTGLNL